jgi:ribosome-binding ATPase
MKIGLVGFPGSGKTTVFNALTGLSAETGFGSKSAKPNLGTAKVPDARVDALARLYSPKKTVYAEVTFSDLPGGQSARGLDRAVLNSMREVDALCQVVRAFESPDHAEPPDALREIADLEAETILADLDLVEKRVARMKKEKGTGRELELLEKLLVHLNDAKPLRSAALSPEDRALVSGYRFLTLLPVLLVLNVDEAAAGAPAPAKVAEAASSRGLGLIVLSAKVEMDIAQMPAAEQQEFCESLGLSEPAKSRFLRSAFELLDLVSMLTAGPDECRAWPIGRGTKAQRAAGKIHSDIERGFIRAEVCFWEDLVALGSEAKCRDAGKLKVEGKEYVMRDGDVVNFRFNV